MKNPRYTFCGECRLNKKPEVVVILSECNYCVMYLITANYVDRVFQFQEGDQGSKTCSSKSLMKVFVKGFTLHSVILHKSSLYSWNTTAAVALCGRNLVVARRTSSVHA